MSSPDLIPGPQTVAPVTPVPFGLESPENEIDEMQETPAPTSMVQLSRAELLALIDERAQQKAQEMLAQQAHQAPRPVHMRATTSHQANAFKPQFPLPPKFTGKNPAYTWAMHLSKSKNYAIGCGISEKEGTAICTAQLA